MIELSNRSPETEVRENITGESASPVEDSPWRKTMLATAEGADIRLASPHANALSRFHQDYGEPGDNAFHLDYLAR
jgi:hypothetical protein